MQKDTVAFKKNEAEKAYHIVKNGGLVVIPTKVGYILAGSSKASLQRKFFLKNRPETKPAVVLTRYNQLGLVAELPEGHKAFIDAIEKTKMLCGFILPRKKEIFAKIDPIASAMSQLPDGTSCFVINHGAYSEHFVDLGVEDGVFILASSANQSGKGNNGKFEHVGERILTGADLAIEHNAYVAQRYTPGSGEQGVMVSLLGERAKIIRKGLNCDEIAEVMTQVYGKDGWDMRHGDYA